MTGLYYNESLCSPPSNSPLNCGKNPESYNPYGGVPPYRFSATGLPIGLTMRSDGLLYGTIPSNAITKDYEISVCIVDSASTEVCSETTLTVKRGCEKHWYQGTGSVSGDGHCYDPVGCVGRFTIKTNLAFVFQLNYDLFEDEAHPGSFPIECYANTIGEFNAKTIVYDILNSGEWEGEDCSSATVTAAPSSGKLYGKDGTSLIDLRTYTGDYEEAKAAGIPPVAGLTCHHNGRTYFPDAGAIVLYEPVVSSDSITYNDCRVYTGEIDSGTCVVTRVS
jgi:hypothetical protein